MDNITELTNRVIAFRDARDWKKFHNPKDVSLSLVLEASELMELFQWKNSDEMAKFIETNKADIGDELADVLYWVLLMSHDLKIDIAAALKSKLEKNEAKYPIVKSKGKHLKYSEYK
jgi:NTP pyrophosphatase (non-canonical NTP hydrolase)